jgi:hypothetical protein
MHAARHRTDEAGDLGTLAFKPQLGKALALELTAEELADPRSREPYAPFLPRLRIEHEDIGKKIAEMGGIDIAPRGGGPFAAQPVPMGKEPLCRGKPQAVFLAVFRLADLYRPRSGAFPSRMFSTNVAKHDAILR